MQTKNVLTHHHKPGFSLLNCLTFSHWHERAVNGLKNHISYSINFGNIVITLYGIVCVQQGHFNSGDWKDISIAHVIIIIKSEVSTLPIIICFRGSMPEMFVISYSVTYCIYIPEKTGIVLSLFICGLWWVQIVGYVLPCRLCSFVCTLHHLIALRSRAIVIEIFWHLDTRANISFLSFVNCVFIHGVSIFLLSRTICHALDRIPSNI